MKTDPKFPPKVCLTSSGFLVHHDKVLLIKHKKLGYWLAPGGHMEKDELPHQAAEREVWEETGIKVTAVSAVKMLKASNKTSYVPSPFSLNLHWISPENYQARIKSDNPDKRHPSKVWSRGCEQHLVFTYLVQSEGSLDFQQNMEETDGIGWFGVEDLDKIEIIPEIVEEAKAAIKYAKELKS